MTYRLGATSWAAGALVLAAISGCSGNGPAADPSTSPTASSFSPTAGPSSKSPMSPSEAAASDASSLVRRYFSVLDDLRMQPTSPLSALRSVTTSTQLTAQTHLVQAERTKGLHQVGSTRIAQLLVQSVNLDNSDPSAGQVPTVVIDVCWDVSNADLVDESGQSVVSPMRADRGWTRYTTANYTWSANPSGGWRIASSQDLKQMPCAAS